MSDQEERRGRGRPEGSVQTAESILRAEMRENRTLLAAARKRLSKMLEDGMVNDQAEVLAKVIDTLSKALQGVSKQLATPGAVDERPLSEKELQELLKGGR